MPWKKNTDLNHLIDHLFRHESAKIVSVLTGIFGTDNLIVAEDIVQDTLAEAIDNWAYNGIPENPTAWLYKVAKNKSLNAIKRNHYSKEYINYARHSNQIEESLIDDLFFSEKKIADDQLRMMFLCCNPSISESSQIALILKILCGF